MSGIIKKLVLRRIQIKKVFLNFVFFEGLSRIEVLLYSHDFVHFSVIFLQDIFYKK